MEEHHHSFRAMNTDVDIFVMAARRPLEAFVSVELLFAQQEERFSRFRGTSLLSRFNRGEPIDDRWFAAALRLALAMHHETRGIFNPGVLPSLLAAGYDRTFEEVAGGHPVAAATTPFRDTVRISGDRCELVCGGIDLGGIVKGWTVDLAVELLARDYPDVLVNAGGDMRCAGSDGAGRGWLVEIDGVAGGAGWSGRITGALATSTTLKRRWMTDAGSVAHHLIDPATGEPAESAYVQASVTADSCVRAECWAKAVVIGGAVAFDRAATVGVEALAWESDGSVRWTGFFAR